MNTQLDTSKLDDLNTAPAGKPSGGRIVAIASGKGGVGKTSLTLNLARAASKNGHKVLVFDGDLGLANVDVQLGLTPGKDLSAVIAGKANLADIVSTAQNAGFDVIPGRSGSETLPFTTALERHDILKQLQTLAASYDLVLLDVAAGVGEEVLTFASMANTTLLVVTPDPSSITDGYAVIKLLNKRYRKNNCQILINQPGTALEGRKTYEKIKVAADKFLGLDVPLFGVVPYDKNYLTAVRQQSLLVDSFPHEKSAESLLEMANSLVKDSEVKDSGVKDSGARDSRAKDLGQDAK